jgi:hypothetical protein
MRAQSRIRVGEAGEIEVVDPGIDDVQFLQSIDSGFRVRADPLPGFESPRVLKARRQPTRIARDELNTVSRDELLSAHAEARDAYSADESNPAMRTTAMRQRRRSRCASFLDLKIELAYRVWRYGGRIDQLPIVFTDRVRGVSKMTWQVAVEELTLVTGWGIRDRVFHRRPRD